MRVFGIVSFLILVLPTIPLFAQQSSGDTSAGTSSINTDFGATYQGATSQGVENVSAQGGFIGSGVPSGFVGIDEIYFGSGSSNANRAASPRRASTTARATARPATQRRAATQPGAARSNLMGSNNQFVRSVASVDFDVLTSTLPQQIASGTIEASLQRIQGMRDGQIALKSSPTGTTAVLTGTVASDRERRVAEQRLLLEPGISRVHNLLEIR